MKRGFTLIELLIVIAIIGIVSAIAYPSYTSAMYKSRRSDAITMLLNLHLAQEKWRANHTSYASNFGDLGLPGGPNFTTESGYYSLAIANVSASGYTITATIDNAGKQNGDTCNNYVVNQNGPDTSAGNANTQCWGQ